MRRFFAHDLTSDRVELDKDSSHHLLRVTGIAPGESVELVDGKGGHAEARLLASERGRAILEVSRRLPSIPRTENTVLVVGLLRAAVFDQVIRQATELGVDRIIPVRAMRSVAREEKRDRWERVARAALIQSGRSLLPIIDGLTDLKTVMERIDCGLRRIVLSPGGTLIPARGGGVVIFVGPEGGWSPDELVWLEQNGVNRYGLGALTLRAETATIAALARVLD